MKNKTIIIGGWEYKPETIVNKEGLYFLIWQTTKIIEHKFVEYLGPFKNKQEVKNHFPHASIFDYTSTRLSNDRKRLIELILQYWEFQRNPTIINTSGKIDYPVDVTNCATIPSVDYHIYAQNDCVWVQGHVPDAIEENWNGRYTHFTPKESCYKENGTISDIELGNILYIFSQNAPIRVIKVDKTTPFAHVIYVSPLSTTLPILNANDPMLLWPGATKS